MRWRAVLLPLLAAAAVAAPVRGVDPASTSEAEKAAEAASRSWLGMVDAGRYGESWDAGSTLFRASLTKDQWEAALDKVRRPLGKVSSRKLRGAKYLTEVPNAPKGEYVVIEFSTDFESKPGAVETITPMKDRDGAWRVAGYFIR